MHVDDSTRKSGCYWNQMLLMILIKMLTALRMFFFFTFKTLLNFICWETKLLTQKNYIYDCPFAAS